MKKIRITSKITRKQEKNIDLGVDTTLYRFSLYAHTDFKCDITINISFDTLKVYPNEVEIILYDFLYETSIIKKLEDTKLDRVDSILYELLGRYFGVYEGSKPDDFMVLEFDDMDNFNIIADNLGFDD